VADWSKDVYCSADVSGLLNRLEEAEWVLDSLVGEYAVVTCNCQEVHTARVILWPVVPALLQDVVRMLETTTCLGETT
jgi:hypothetical protein